MEHNTLTLPKAYEPQDLTPSPDLESSKLKVPDSFIRKLESEGQEQSIISRAVNDVGDFAFSSEVFKAPVHGMVEGVNQTITTLEHALKPMVETPVHLFSPEYELSFPHLPNVNAPQTATGNLVSNVSQFAVPFTWALKGMKALNIVSRLGSKAPGAIAAGAGFIADSVAFDPYEERLCNLVADHGPDLTKPIFDALKADTLDGECEARLKRGVEGLALGGLTSSVIKMVQKMRWLKTHKERVASSTGGTYEPDEGILQAASDLSYWSGHRADESLLHKTLAETSEAASHPDHFAALKELTQRHNGHIMTQEASSIFMVKASERWANLLQSKAWAELPEAAKQDLESVFLKSDQTHWPESLTQAMKADKLKRQASTEAKVSANLNQEMPHVETLGTKDSTVTHTVTKDSGETLLSIQTHQVKAFQEALSNFDEETASRVIGRGINFANIASTDETIKVMKTLQELMADGINNASGNVRTWADTNKIASIIGSRPENVTSSLNTLFDSSKLMDSQIRASGIYLQSLFETLRREAVKIDLGEAGAEQIANFVRLKTLTGETLKMYQGIKSNIARSLNSLKMPLYGKELSETQLTEIFKAQGGVTNIRALAKAFASCPSNEELSKLVKPTFYAKTRDAVLEYFMNSVLSGPSTHAVNIMSTAAHTLWQPLERFTAGLIMADKDMLVEGTYLTRGIFDSLRDILRWTALGSSRHADESFAHVNPFQGATKAFMADRNLINANSMNDVSRPKAISAERFGLQPAESIIKALDENNYAEAIRSSMIHGLDYLGKAINLPGRFLLAEDEFFKIINYRSSIRALAAQEVKLASQMGQSVDGLYETILVNPKQHGNLHEKALAFADLVSFTTPLAEGTLSHSLNQIAHKHPGLRFIIPFIRTPANILKFAHHRTPGLNLLSKQYRQELMSSDPMVQKQALGKLFGGWILWASAFGLAEEGVIMGGVPKGKGEGMRNTGRLAYSLACQDESGGTNYVQFSRMDPFGMFFGLAADLHHIFHQLPEEHQENLATASLIAISQNINTRGYLVGLTNLLNALSDGNRYGQRFAANYLSSLIPNVLKQNRKDEDSVQRIAPKNPFEDLESLISFYKSQLPGHSTELPARLNLFGEEVTYPSPLGQGLLKGIATSKDSQNPVAEEMFRLKMSGRPPMDEIEGVPLSPEQYHAYIQLCAKPTSNMDLKSMLGTIISSRSYEQMPEGDESVEGHKQHALKSVIQLYRKLGQAKLLEKYPDLNAQVLDQRMKKIRGNP